MLKVMFWDKSIVYCQDTARAVIESHMGTSKKMKLYHLGNPDIGDMVIGSAIYRVTEAPYREYEHMLPRPKALPEPAKPELTDEQRAERRAKLDKMRQDFLNRKVKPKEANDGQKANEPGVRREVR